MDLLFIHYTFLLRYCPGESPLLAMKKRVKDDAAENPHANAISSTEHALLSNIFTATSKRLSDI